MRKTLPNRISLGMSRRLWRAQEEGAPPRAALFSAVLMGEFSRSTTKKTEFRMQQTTSVAKNLATWKAVKTYDSFSDGISYLHATGRRIECFLDGARQPFLSSGATFGENRSPRVSREPVNRFHSCQLFCLNRLLENHYYRGEVIPKIQLRNRSETGFPGRRSRGVSREPMDAFKLTLFV